MVKRGFPVSKGMYHLTGKPFINTVIIRIQIHIHFLITVIEDGELFPIRRPLKRKAIRYGTRGSSTMGFLRMLGRDKVTF